MNKPRRKELERALALIGEARAIIEQCAEEEREAFENLPESIQYGEQGEKIDGIAYVLEDACGTLEDIENTVQDEAIDA